MDSINKAREIVKHLDNSGICKETRFLASICPECTAKAIAAAIDAERRVTLQEAQDQVEAFYRDGPECQMTRDDVRCLTFRLCALQRGGREEP